MGKEKETFEVWSKPKRKGNVGARANPSNDAPSTVATKQLPKEKGNNRKPREMKTTVVTSASFEVTAEAQHDLENESVQEGISNEGQGGSTGPKEIRIPHEKKGASVVARKLPLSEAGNQRHAKERGRIPPADPYGIGTQRIVKDKARVASPNLASIGTRHLGKEIARSSSPSSNPDWELESTPMSKRFGDQDRRGNRTRSYAHMDSEEDNRDNRGRSQKSKRKVSPRQSGDWSDSSPSKSPVMAERRKREVHGVGRQRREGQRVEGVRRRTEQSKRRSSNDSDESSPREVRTHSRHRSNYAVRSPSPPQVQQFDPNCADSENDESSRSSEEQQKYRRESTEEKSMKAESYSQESESTKRRGRRHQQGEREAQRQQRERQGLKGHYIIVDYRGIPYGFGVGAWRQELNKMCVSLDPSVTNIRYQPKESMATLRQRLKMNFEYSAPIDRAYIRKLAGKCVTQRRSRIIASMKEGDLCPAGLDLEVWHRLDRICQDPHREELSQQMKFANAARQNKGRTGPKGEEGIREELHRQLGRDPDPDELQYEMRRKKGYCGVAQKRRASRDKQRSCSMATADGVGGIPERGERNLEDLEGVPSVHDKRRVKGVNCMTPITLKRWSRSLESYVP